MFDITHKLHNTREKKFGNFDRKKLEWQGSPGKPKGRRDDNI